METYIEILKFFIMVAIPIILFIAIMNYTIRQLDKLDTKLYELERLINNLIWEKDNKPPLVNDTFDRGNKTTKSK